MKGVQRAAELLCKVFLALQVIVVSYVVAGRFIFRKSPGWGEELALLCMVWFSLLSISIGVFNNAHITMPLLETVIPKKWRGYLGLVNQALALAFALSMIVSGIYVTILNHSNIMPGMNVPSSVLYLSIPVSGFFLLLSLLGKTKENV